MMTRKKRTNLSVEESNVKAAAQYRGLDAATRAQLYAWAYARQQVEDGNETRAKLVEIGPQVASVEKSLQDGLSVASSDTQRSLVSALESARDSLGHLRQAQELGIAHSEKWYKILSTLDYGLSQKGVVLTAKAFENDYIGSRSDALRILEGDRGEYQAQGLSLIDSLGDR